MSLDHHRKFKSEVTLDVLKRIHNQALELSPKSRPFGDDLVHIDSTKTFALAGIDIQRLQAYQKLSPLNFHNDCVNFIRKGERMKGSGAEVYIRRRFKIPEFREVFAGLAISEGKCCFEYSLLGMTYRPELEVALNFIANPLLRAGIPLEVEWIGAKQVSLSSLWAFEDIVMNGDLGVQRFFLIIPFEELQSLEIFEQFLSAVEEQGAPLTEISASIALADTKAKPSREALEFAMQDLNEVSIAAKVDSLEWIESIRRSLPSKAKIEFRLVTFVFPDDDSNWGDIMVTGSSKGYKITVSSDLPLKKPMLAALGLGELA